MNKAIAAAALVAAIFLAGCQTEVRYSPSEISRYPADVQAHIRAGEVTMGMTPDEVRFAWGSPSDINVQTPAANGDMREQWIYKDIASSTTLQFTAGKVTEMSSSGISGKKFVEPKSGQ
ncbi:MAG: hypothetical protein M0Z52_01095 [Actinomycetota bacterium]|nr:hypothetical protein [Actinomycetota bacterium]